MKVYGHELKNLKDRPDTKLDIKQKEKYVSTHTILNAKFKGKERKQNAR
jgi:hypothetical protein